MSSDADFFEGDEEVNAMWDRILSSDACQLSMENHMKYDEDNSYQSYIMRGKKEEMDLYKKAYMEGYRAGFKQHAHSSAYSNAYQKQHDKDNGNDIKYGGF